MTLIGYWPLNETEGDTAYDYSGNENHGSLEGSPNQGASGIVGSNGYEFDGENDYVEALQERALADFDGQEITVTGWVYLNNFDSRHMFTFTGGGWSRKGMYHAITTSGGVRFQIGDGDDEEYSGDGIGSVPANEWVHVVSLWKDGRIYAYVNGEEFEGPGWDPGYYSNPEYNVKIGHNLDSSDNHDHYFDGKIKEVRIYNRALTPIEVQYLYNVSKRGRFTSRKKQP